MIGYLQTDLFVNCGASHKSQRKSLIDRTNFNAKFALFTLLLINIIFCVCFNFYLFFCYSFIV